jgi:hypothetical protein
MDQGADGRYDLQVFCTAMGGGVTAAETAQDVVIASKDNAATMTRVLYAHESVHLDVEDAETDECFCD